MWLHCLHQHWHRKQPNDGLVTLRKQIPLIFSPYGYLATDKHLGHESKRGHGDSVQKCFFPSAAISSSLVEEELYLNAGAQSCKTAGWTSYCACSRGQRCDPEDGAPPPPSLVLLLHAASLLSSLLGHLLPLRGELQLCLLCRPHLILDLAL